MSDKTSLRGNEGEWEWEVLRGPLDTGLYDIRCLKDICLLYNAVVDVVVVSTQRGVAFHYDSHRFFKVFGSVCRHRGAAGSGQ